MTWPGRTRSGVISPGCPRRRDDHVGRSASPRRNVADLDACAARPRVRRLGWGRRRSRAGRPPSLISVAIPKPAAPRPIWPTTTSVEPLADLAARRDRGRQRHDRGPVDVVVHHRLRRARRSAAARSRSTRAPRCPRGGSRRTSGAIRTTVSTNSSTSRVSIRIGIALMPTSCGRRRALPSITGMRRDRPDVAEAEHARAVRADRDAAPDHREARRASVGRSAIAWHTRATPGV